MNVQLCMLFLACAFYLGYCANSLERGKVFVWCLSLLVGLIPICELVFEAVRRMLR